MAPSAHSGSESGADFQRLAYAIELLSAARTADDVIEVVRRSARGLSGAQGVAVVLRDEDRCHYLAEDSDSPLWAGLKFPIGGCISGWAMTNGKPAIVPDVFADARIPHEAYRPTFVKSLVMTPVGEDPAFAAIGAYWDSVREPAHEEIGVLAALARSTATAFKNVQLYENLRREAERYDTLYHQALQSERRLQLMVNELNHRVKNSLAMVQAIAAQTFRASGSMDQAQTALTGRIVALARAHDVLTENRWDDADLKEVVQGATTAYAGAGLGRIASQGPTVSLPPKAAICLSLALHELATNAVKHGALSDERGTVTVVWALSEQDNGGAKALTLDWTEQGGPLVAPAPVPGFGMRLLTRGLPADLGGTVDIQSRPEGVHCRITARLEAENATLKGSWQ